ncbi:MAG: DUF1588 domain-containing protein, partial [Planctomycetota bacterium]
QVSISGPFFDAEDVARSETTLDNRNDLPQLFAPIQDQWETLSKVSPKTAASTQHLKIASAAATQCLTPVLIAAYRGGDSTRHLDLPMQFFRDAYQEKPWNDAEKGSTTFHDRFHAGMRAAIQSILTNPRFLFRIESGDPEENGLRRLNADEFAARVGAFLWGSLPDQRVRQSIAAAFATTSTHDRNEQIGETVKGMLADPRGRWLSDRFATQWLYLNNLDSITPDLRQFGDWDNNLRQSMREETRLLFDDTLRGGHSILRLIDTRSTFLNERLAVHYGIGKVRGSRFRLVDLDAVPGGSRRGGILRHASILTVTSYANRTSPTVRGNWVLENLLGTPAPPPPPDVPALEEKTVVADLTVRQRLEMHRDNPACAACHRLMDPIGFALENYDAVGRFRFNDGDAVLETGGELPDGSAAANVKELEWAILQNPRQFADTVTRKLLTFGLGRGLEPGDGPAVRRIVDSAADLNYRLDDLIIRCVQSDLFAVRMPMNSNGTRQP